MFPHLRLRRNRRFPWLRDLIAEASLNVTDLVYPLFVIEGQNLKQEISTLPGVCRFSIDKLKEEVKLAHEYGIKAVALFPVVDQALKDDKATEAYNLDNLICRAIRAIKDLDLSIGIICDVALDPYTLSGHDGIWHDSDVDNDKTLYALCNQALTLAKAGADIIAPSDMMDGRIKAIREYLDKDNYYNLGILSYSAKYASNLYGPFREAVGSKSFLKSDKKTYQMDYRNIKEALREIELDIAEGADMVMIKPGMLYLDIVQAASARFDVPIFAYQVSGEYAMLKYAAQNNCFNWQQAIIESLICMKRAGAKSILTYAALEVSKMLNE
ncbi:MAG: hemB [Rickettsiaceae bacterium]|jgi:porphobilinogen synthase|nr:hemB [Rickettsiaceae bacterium]